MPEVNPQPVAAGNLGGSSEGAAPDPLGKLYHMSATAGVGTQEYVAINPTAVAALILGFGSILVFLSSMLLVIPLAGLICGIIAVVQVRRSNGTQTGMGLAVGGILLCLGFGGSRAGYQLLRQFHTSSDEQQIAQLMHTLGSEINAGHYDQAYAMFGERFHNRINRATFEDAFKRFHTLSDVGDLQWIEWNQQTMIFEEEPGNDVTIGSAMGIFKFSANEAAPRSVMTFAKIDGVWQINDMEGLFPSKKQQQQ
ncbi:MAG TPA: hypothetical protein VK797_17110 [Tepidisphaeraceae bacterium]|jgi:hypothetical protein|nr:hypothetical protein [Tepidisphaeraceae bacterium]